MQQPKLFGRLVLSLEHVEAITPRVREKLLIPEILLEDRGLVEIVLSDMHEPIDWVAVRQAIDHEIRNAPGMLPAEFAAYPAMKRAAGWPMADSHPTPLP